MLSLLQTENSKEDVMLLKPGDRKPLCPLQMIKSKSLSKKNSVARLTNDETEVRIVKVTVSFHVLKDKSKI